MRFLQEYIYTKVVEGWKAFPWKVDYIIHLLLSNNENLYEIQFKLVNNNYVAVYTKGINQADKKFKQSLFIIDKDELLNYFNIDQSQYHDFVAFSYITKIFTNSSRFRGQKSLMLKEDLIILRLMGDEKMSFSDFNNKLEKYILSHYLNDDLTYKDIVSKDMVKL